MVGNVREVDRFCQGVYIGPGSRYSLAECLRVKLDPEYLLVNLGLSGDGEDIRRIEFGEWLHEASVCGYQHILPLRGLAQGSWEVPGQVLQGPHEADRKLGEPLSR